MSSNIFKSLFLGFFSSALIGCSSDEETPACQYKSNPQMLLEHSRAPETLGLAFQQRKLVELMWTNSAQSECFLRKNGGVQVFKIASSQNANEESFVTLKPAPQASQQNWLESQNQINQDQINVTLLGLTSFKFYSTPTERIVSAEILLRADGRPWHLWHEYAHFLIGELRVQSSEMSLRNPTSGEVKKALAEFLAQPVFEKFEEKFKIFSDLQLDYMKKEFMDEILIEKTLQDLISQAPNFLPVDRQDFLDSQEVIERFKKKYNTYFKRQENELNGLFVLLSQEQQALIQAHVVRMHQQLSQLLALTP